jgi:transposase
MIGPPIGTQVWLAAGATDMRKGFDRLAMLVQRRSCIALRRARL